MTHHNTRHMAGKNDLKLLSLHRARCYSCPRWEGSVDLVFNTIVGASSLALFLYWFRYGCLLILAAETPHDHHEEVAQTHQLCFPEVRSMLRREDLTDLDRLERCLERDFVIIANLLEHTPATRLDTWFEDAMLRSHYHSMRACFRLTRGNLRELAVDALEEMLLVVAHLANQVGERRLKSMAA
jgi:hypothetical protein